MIFIDEKRRNSMIPTIAQLVERRTVELRGYPSVAGSIPACRSFFIIKSLDFL
jgi:hypothetical protein